MLQLFYCCFVLLLLPSLNAEEDLEPCGTVIVTYQTDDEGERLDRVRFWLRNEKYEQQMFPQGNAFVDDPEQKSRMVVIEGIPVGKYQIHFIVPNGDNYFEPPPMRTFALEKEGAVRIEETIQKKRHET